MLTALIVLYTLVCFMLVAVVFLQRGKDSAGDLFGSGADAVLSSQGTTSFLVKLTSVLGFVFFAVCVSLIYFMDHSANKINASYLVATSSPAVADASSKSAQSGTKAAAVKSQSETKAQHVRKSTVASGAKAGPVVVNKTKRQVKKSTVASSSKGR